MGEFYLMNKDTPVLFFTSEKNEYQEVYLEEEKWLSDKKPLGFTDIQTFVECRQAPKHRAHIMELLRRNGCEELEGFMRITKGLSLNDTYWIREADHSETWDEVSLYQNDFNDTIARYAISGCGEDEIMSSTSPEFATDGSYAKCWVRRKEGICLLKSGLTENGLEPFSEYYASQVAAGICKASVVYEAEIYHDRLVSVCPLFTSEKIGYLPAGRLLDDKRHDKVSYLLQYFSKLGLEDAFRRMLVLDALIVNIDRHSGNYGFLVDNEKQAIVGMAPVFDHNRSLLHDLRDTEQIMDYMKNCVPRIGNDFNQTAHMVLTPEIIADLKKMREFHFVRKGEPDLPEERIAILELVLHKQVENILTGKRLYYFR